MKTEARLFIGVAGFFLVTAVGYGWRSKEPAGTAVLTIAFLMAALVAFFLHMQYRRRGLRAQDRPDAEVADTAGPLHFFAPHSPWPITTALGSVLAALGVVYGLWLFLLGVGVLGHGVFGMVFQYVGRDAQRSSSSADDSRSSSTR
ncbi:MULTISPECIES: aa3-type cytochrome oxidase subunit IV [unclassified Streptomyces]|uniref:aa3-type cytochrome oxidase subunit IV n=1 Tax=unclassified Streptomyces TaxID=2593676 RepID=UPI00265B9C21|nr:cytochrome c oxidase subunit 4 [Streptomyces sp. DT2A-34]MDO0917456.1 cytochrome c oxidase subunit 4 [Streptomyces sp. DT2A-34]